MKFLIDECLSPELVLLARARGYGDSTHVTWIGMSGRPDHLVARRAIDDGYSLVTHNTADFRPLYGRATIHAGLVGFNTPARVMTLTLQKALFLQALTEFASGDPINVALEISVEHDGLITIAKYDLPK